MPIRTLVSIGVSFVICILLYSTANAFSAPASMQERQLIYQGKTYFLVTGKYVPPVVITPIQAANAKYDTPEDAMVNFVSAILNKDYDFFFKNWTVAGQKYKQDRDVSLGLNRDYWVRRWSAADNILFEVRYRADYVQNDKTYVLIGYALKGIKVEGDDLETDMLFEKENGKWLGSLIQEADPVGDNIFKIWKSDEKVVVVE